MIQFGTKYGPYGPSILHYKNTFGQVDIIVPSPFFTIFYRFSIISHHIVHHISEKTSPFTIFQHILGTDLNILSSPWSWLFSSGLFRAGSETCRVKGLVITFTGNGDKDVRPT